MGMINVTVKTQFNKNKHSFEDHSW